MDKSEHDIDRQHEYIGDGVYVAFDGYQIAIRVGSHENQPCVWFEPEVMATLVNYAKRVGVLKDGEAALGT